MCEREVSEQTSKGDEKMKSWPMASQGGAGQDLREMGKDQGYSSTVVTAPARAEPQ